MNLTHEEKSLRDYYPGKRHTFMAAASFEVVALVVGVGAFLFGFFASVDDRAMMFLLFLVLVPFAFYFAAEKTRYFDRIRVDKTVVEGESS